ncbi:MAG: hypothetical protein JG776_973 [Caloramator sp.]|jgi:hypothetical protein|uniref:hypothetical protein n=1 Tax=Caloramator sp. TaxID=1871330 RepID=UPI001D8866D2|nr:hypothetical protein [Caloramator sp.]MBZ4663271.1 hypothetical protein [Caloramator sp.]
MKKTNNSKCGKIKLIAKKIRRKHNSVINFTKDYRKMYSIIYNTSCTEGFNIEDIYSNEKIKEIIWRKILINKYKKQIRKLKHEIELLWR